MVRKLNARIMTFYFGGRMGPWVHSWSTLYLRSHFPPRARTYVNDEIEWDPEATSIRPSAAADTITISEEEEAQQEEEEWAHMLDDAEDGAEEGAEEGDEGDEEEAQGSKGKPTAKGRPRKATVFKPTPSASSDSAIARGQRIYNHRIYLADFEDVEAPAELEAPPKVARDAKRQKMGANKCILKTLAAEILNIQRELVTHESGEDICMKEAHISQFVEEEGDSENALAELKEELRDLREELREMRESRKRELHSRAAAVADLGVEPRACWNIIQTICHFETFLKRDWGMRGGDEPPAALLRRVLADPDLRDAVDSVTEKVPPLGWTPLRLVCAGNNNGQCRRECARVLIEAKADINRLRGHVSICNLRDRVARSTGCPINYVTPF